MKLSILVFLGLIAGSANASIIGVVTAARDNVQMTAELNASSELVVKLSVNQQTANCTVSISDANLGYTTPRNLRYEDMKDVNFFGFWHGRECSLKAWEAKDFLEKQDVEIKFFEAAKMSVEKGLEILKNNPVKLSFCFQPNDGYECSKPVGYEDLKNGPVQVYPYKTK